MLLVLLPLTYATPITLSGGGAIVTVERLVDAQAVIQQASLLGQAALGDRAGKRARRVQVLGGKELALPPRCASFAGYSLHALRRRQPAGHPAHPRRPPPRDRPAGSRRRGRRPEGVNTRDRGRSRARRPSNAAIPAASNV
jgi:hypothetical protein